MLIRYKSILIMSQVMSSYQSSTAHLLNELKLITYMSTQYKIFIIRVWAFENVSLNACTWRTCRTNIWSTYSSKRRKKKEEKKKHLKHFTEKPISPTILSRETGKLLSTDAADYTHFSSWTTHQLIWVDSFAFFYPV